MSEDRLGRDPTRWRPGDNRACKDADPDLFFGPDDPAAARRFKYSAAKRICDGCPIELDCREWAIVTGQRHGMWGGWKPAELQAERDRRRRVAAAGGSRHTAAATAGGAG
jgi:Transcription factor WhiB